MNKPDWKDAPEWAQFLAMDEDGTWYWYRTLPQRAYIGWSPTGRYESVSSDRAWQDTLEGRP